MEPFPIGKCFTLLHARNNPVRRGCGRPPSPISMGSWCWPRKWSACLIAGPIWISFGVLLLLVVAKKLLLRLRRRREEKYLRLDLRAATEGKPNTSQNQIQPAHQPHDLLYARVPLCVGFGFVWVWFIWGKLTVTLTSRIISRCPVTRSTATNLPLLRRLLLPAPLRHLRSATTLSASGCPRACRIPRSRALTIIRSNVGSNARDRGMRAWGMELTDSITVTLLANFLGLSESNA